MECSRWNYVDRMDGCFYNSMQSRIPWQSSRIEAIKEVNALLLIFGLLSWYKFYC